MVDGDAGGVVEESGAAVGVEGPELGVAAFVLGEEGALVLLEEEGFAVGHQAGLMAFPGGSSEGGDDAVLGLGPEADVGGDVVVEADDGGEVEAGVDGAGEPVIEVEGLDLAGVEVDLGEVGARMSFMVLSSSSRW